MTNMTSLLFLAALGSATLFACASPTDASAPDAEDDALDSATFMVGSWSLTAETPVKNADGTMQAVVTIAGSVGSMGGGGVCLLKRTNTACTPSGSTDVATDQAWLSQASQCGTKPFADGFWYCLKQGADTAPTCAIRPGNRVNFCAGSPTRIEQGLSPAFALPSNPTTLMTPAQTVGLGKYYSYACPGQCEESASIGGLSTTLDTTQNTTCTSGTYQRYQCQKTINTYQ